MANELLEVKVDYLLNMIQSLMDESRGNFTQKNNIVYLEKVRIKVREKLAVNKKMDEEITERLLNFRDIPVHEIMHDLKCSESMAKKIKECIENEHNEYYRTLRKNVK